MTSDQWWLPLSGDVSQTFNPFAWFVQGGQQAGFININASKSGDPELERRIVAEVASYGRQLGRLVDVVEVLAARLPPEGLTAAEQAALDDFADLVRRIRAVKDEAGRHEGLTLGGVDRLIDDLDDLRRRDEAAYRRIVGRLRDALGADPSASTPPADSAPPPGPNGP